MQHPEFNDIAANAAAEAVKNLLCGVDVEGGRFFPVKGTDAEKISSGFFQGNIFRN
jgi:hypothetical protein